MKNLNLEKNYLNLDKHIKLFSSYLDKPYYCNIIKFCRLIPYDFNIKDYKKIKLFNKWQDEYGNSLNIEKNKKIKIIYNDLSIKKIFKTDIYQGLCLEKIFKISKLLFVLIAKDEDFNKDFIIISLLGIDNYLRTYVYYLEEWSQASSLILGEELLLNIFNNLDLKYFKELKIKKIHIPCQNPKAWITCIPVHKNFTVLKLNEALQFLTKGNN